MHFQFIINALAAIFSIGLWTQGNATAGLPVPQQIAQAKSLEPTDRMLDDIFTNFQIVEVVGTEASGYIDIQSLYKKQFTQTDADAFFSTFARKANELLPFFTDKKLTAVKIQIIRITNINQYNVGSGFTKVGEARLAKEGDEWKSDAVALIDGGAK